MNLNQVSAIKAQLEILNDIDINAKIAESYPDQDLNTILVGDMSLEDFLLYLNKIKSIFKLVINKQIFRMLPHQYNYQNEFGGGNLENDFVHIIAYLNSNQFPNAAFYVQKVVYFLIIHQLWSEKSIKNEYPDKDQILVIKELNKTLAERLRVRLNEAEILLETLKVSIDNLNTFIGNKNSELEQISNLLTSARNNQEEIARLLNSSTEINQHISGIYSQQKEKLEEIKVETEKYQSALEGLKAINSEFDKKKEDISAIFSDIFEKSKNFDRKLLELNEIIGKEGAVALFRTFNDRKKELIWPVRIWACCVIVTGILALTAIFAIFTNLFGILGIPPEITWEVLVVNSIKSLPIMVVLLFAIRQYVRERNFQEEYAFRSAIALTIQAYSELAGNKRDELIFKAVSNIYQTPRTMKEKVSSIFSIRSKDLSDSLKEISTTLKEMKK